jgi:hypothetical protein
MGQVSTNSKKNQREIYFTDFEERKKLYRGEKCLPIPKRRWLEGAQ